MMRDTETEAYKLGLLLIRIDELHVRIRRKLRAMRLDGPVTFSFVCFALEELVRDPHGIQLAIELQGNPEGYAMSVWSLQGIERQFASELWHVRALVAAYPNPDVPLTLLTDPDALRAAYDRLRAR